MIKKYFILIFIVMLTISSCVSKKKFTEMESGRLKAEEQVMKLTDENNYQASRIEALISDFENMKNELLESNAVKDQYIDSINNEMFAVRETLAQQKESLQQTSFNYGFERQRMIEELKVKDNTITSLNSRIESLDKEISRQSSLLDDKNLQLQVLGDRLNILQGERERAEQQGIELQEKLNQVQDEIKKLNAVISEKDQTITRLQNNVNLLKKELGRN
jgi:chromosome segregation ATPase